MGIHQPLALTGSGASQAQSQRASALGEEIRKGSECSQTKFRETAQSTSSTKFSPKSNRCILVFNDFFSSLKGDLMNAQNCLHRKIGFRNLTFLLSERQGDNSNRWQIETEYKNELSAGQTDPPMGWDRTNTTSRAGHVGHSSSQ